jgi:ribonuclease HII
VKSYRFDREIATGQLIDDAGLFPAADPSLLTTPPIIIAGVDEAGRGPLAGPVVAAAVILPDTPRLTGLRDSKAVPAEQREALYCEITHCAVAYAVGIEDVTTIDEINILAAALQAMRKAIRALSQQPDLVLVDGNQHPKSGRTERVIVKGDQKSASIMAASILAKVTRDHIMKEAHVLYPQYGFNDHKGYACERHIDALRRFGPTPIHRRSFEPLRSMIWDSADVLF